MRGKKLPVETGVRIYGISCKMQHTLGLREWQEPDLWLT